jgi:hypothetical protein
MARTRKAVQQQQLRRARAAGFAIEHVETVNVGVAMGNRGHGVLSVEKGVGRFAQPDGGFVCVTA